MSIDVRNEDLLTVQDVMANFGVGSLMTIRAWRNKETDPLPTIVIPGKSRNTIRFDEDEVKAWAERNGKEYRNEAS